MGRGDPPRPQVVIFLAAVLAGGLIGIPHVAPMAWPAAWIGIAALSALLAREPRRARRVAMVLVSGVASFAVIVGWMWPGFAQWLDWPLWRAGVLWSGLVLAMGTSARLPLALAAVLSVRPRYWFAPAWWLGELFAARVAGLGVGHLLDGQWTVGPILRSVGHLGWSVSLVLLVFCASLVGEAASQRRWAWPALLPLTLLLLPALPRNDSALEGVAAVQLAHFEDRPTQLNASLVVWPEGASRRHPSLDEGSTTAVLDPLPGSGAHLLGLDGRHGDRPVNAVVLADSTGTVSWARFKQVLVPASERSFLGVSLGEPYTPGNVAPLVAVHTRSVVPIVCYEVFDRALVARGVAGGGALIAVLSSDRVMKDSAVGRQQSLAALVLRAVEHGVPALRASLWGSAALVSSDGTVLAEGPPGETRVLRQDRRNRQNRSGGTGTSTVPVP